MPPHGSDSDNLVRAALAKRARGEPLTRKEESAVERAQKAQRERIVEEGLAAIPKKLYVRMSGRQHKVLDDASVRYGLSLRGDTIDLFVVVRQLHDFLAKHGPHIDDDDDAGGDSPALERLRDEKAKIARLQRLEMEGELLTRAEVHDMLMRIASLLRQNAEQFQREGNNDAFDLMNDTLDAAAKEMEQLAADRQPIIEDQA